MKYEWQAVLSLVHLQQCGESVRHGRSRLMTGWTEKEARKIYRGQYLRPIMANNNNGPLTLASGSQKRSEILCFLAYFIIIIISIQPEGRFWQEPEPSQATGMALAHCILGSFLRVGFHCFPPPLDLPTFASRCLHVQATWETSISERRNYGREMAGQFCLWFRLPRKPRVLWHAPQICDMGDGFTSPPRKACCGFFRPKNPTASAGIEPAILGIYIYINASNKHEVTVHTVWRHCRWLCRTENHMSWDRSFSLWVIYPWR